MAAVSAASLAVSITTAHWFAAPFAALFMFGYAYVFVLVVVEQSGHTARSRVASATAAMPRVASPEPSAQGGMARAA
jgi:hypothetical protein